MKVQKLRKLLISSTTAIAALISYHNSSAYADDKQFYVHGSIGASAMNQFTIKNDEDQIAKFKAKAVPNFELGLGHYWNDYLKSDKSIGYLAPKFKIKIKGEDVEGDTKTKIKITHLFINNYASVEVYNDVSAFAGVGLGIAQNKLPKMTDNEDDDDDHTATPKSKTRFAYSLTAGIATKITDNTNLKLSYSWRDFGKLDIVNAKLRGHFVNIGVNYAF